MMFPKPTPNKKRKKHPPSILHNKSDRTCYLCMLLDGNNRVHSVLHEHHIFGGPNRTHSEELGLKVYLCVEHHETGQQAVHRCRETRLLLQRIGQEEYEKTHTRKEFMEIFGKNYME